VINCFRVDGGSYYFGKVTLQILESVGTNGGLIHGYWNKYMLDSIG